MDQPNTENTSYILNEYSRLYSWQEPNEVSHLVSIRQSSKLQLKDAIRITAIPALVIGMANSALIAMSYKYFFIDKNFLFAFFQLVLMQLNWAIYSSLARRQISGEGAYFPVFRVIRTWMLLLPFAILPGFVIGRGLWAVSPARIRHKDQDWRYGEGICSAFIGRYWQATVAMVGVMDSPLRKGFARAARMAILRRNDVFFVIGKDVRHLLAHGAFLVLAVCAVIVEKWFDSAVFWAIGISLAIFFLVGNFMTLLTITWMHMLGRDMQENPQNNQEMLPIPGDEMDHEAGVTMARSLDMFRWKKITMLIEPLFFGYALYRIISYGMTLPGHSF